jgi:hypothetical protein
MIYRKVQKVKRAKGKGKKNKKKWGERLLP